MHRCRRSVCPDAFRVLLRIGRTALTLPGGCTIVVWRRLRRSVPSHALARPPEALRVRQGGVPSPVSRTHPHGPHRPHHTSQRLALSRQHGAPQPRAPGDLRGADPDAAAAGHGGRPGDDAEALVQQQGQQPARALHRHRGRGPGLGDGRPCGRQPPLPLPCLCAEGGGGCRGRRRPGPLGRACGIPG